MITKRHIREAIDKAEKGYEKSWEYLVALKTFPKNDVEISEIFNIQPVLASTLYHLGILYKNIHQEELRLIRKKNDLNNAWFAARMKQLAANKDVVKRTISVGKAIGDAFAWFFYQNDLAYIREHLKKKEIFHFPPGLGGIGEVEFVKQVSHLPAHILIYHGNTSFLRLGDVTLIDKESLRVAGIGELKSTPIREGELIINLILSGPNIGSKIFGKLGDKMSTKYNGASLSVAMKQRLNRQMKEIESSFHHLGKSPDKKTKQRSDYAFNELEALVRQSKCNQFTYRKATHGLLLLSYKIRKNSLFARLSSEEDIDYREMHSELPNYYKSITNEGRSDNSAIVNSLYYNEKLKPTYTVGMAHLFWWPIDQSIIKKILFHEVLVFSIYNPSFLIQKIEDLGYSENTDEEGNQVFIKKDGEKQRELCGINHYLRMIQQYLFTEESIVKMLSSLDKHVNDDNSEMPTKMEIYCEQKI